MREMYRREKRRIRFERWSWLSVSWGLYAMTLLGQAPSPYSPDYKEIQNMILDFEAGALIFLGIFLLLSVNDTLFFIREQGKKVYLLEKYVIVPIHKKKLYEVWVRIFLETILYYIIGASCIYAIMTIANNCIFSPAVLCFGALKVLGVLIILMLFFIVFLICIRNTSFEKNRGTESFGILKIFMAGNLNFLSYNTIKSNEVTKG